jgi:signal transduction histidine kinase
MTTSTPWNHVSLRTKLTVLIESLIIIIVVVTGLITTVHEKETLENEIYKRGLALANDLARFSASPLLSNDLATLRRFVNHTMKQEYVLYALILDPHGKVVMHNNLAEVGKIYRDDVAQLAVDATESGCLLKHLLGKKKLCNIYAPVNVSEARLGTVLLGYSYKAVENEIFAARLRILYICLGTIIIGGIIAYILASFIAQPIKRITVHMEKVSKGDLAAILEIKRHDEIGNLVNSFNRMAADLGKHRKHLEVLVEERTLELTRSNEQLHQEIRERSRAQEELRQSQEQLRNLASHLQSIREEERTHIAREIHDELGQVLTALKMDTHWLQHKLPADQKPLIDKIGSMSKLINTTVQSVRRISTELRPGLLDDFGLSAAIEWQANEFCQRAGIDCNIRSEPEDIILDQAQSTALFRIFQEALTNIARHANASRVDIVLIKNSATVEMQVRDNGRGITQDQVRASKSFGLLGIRERVHSLGGNLNISSTPAKGTSINITLPISAEENHYDQNTYCG